MEVDACRSMAPAACESEALTFLFHTYFFGGVMFFWSCSRLASCFFFELRFIVPLGRHQDRLAQPQSRPQSCDA